MKLLVIAVFLTISLTLAAQGKLLFDTARVDANTKLIGRYPVYDKEKTYRQLNFIIEDIDEIKKAISELKLGAESENTFENSEFNISKDDKVELMELKLGEEIENRFENPGFEIGIIQDDQEVKNWLVNPAFNTVLDSGHYYFFPVNKLKQLSKKHPFDYRFDQMSFASKPEFENYLDLQKKDSSFLFAYSPRFKNEGTFEIQFPRNELFKNPPTTSDYLKPMIESIVNKNEYEIHYYLDEKNKNDRSQFTMTILGSKKLFDELQTGSLQKKNWKKTDEKGWFFYRTK